MSAVQDLPAKAPAGGSARSRLRDVAGRHRSTTILASMALVGLLLPLIAGFPPFTLFQSQIAWIDGFSNAGVFVLLYLRVWRENRSAPEDKAWRARMGEMLRGEKAGMPPVGKYNPGQKLVFWAMSISLLVLVVTGFLFWQPWFTPYFSITVGRIAVLLHAIAAVVMVLAVIVHVYAAIWVKGTVRAIRSERFAAMVRVAKKKWAVPSPFLLLICPDHTAKTPENTGGRGSSGARWPPIAGCRCPSLDGVATLGSKAPRKERSWPTR